MQRVEGSKNGLGFFGYAYYQANKGGLKAVAIEDSETGKCVKPTAKTIKAGTYPISRTLYIYPNNAKVAENPTLKDFLDYYITKRASRRTSSKRGTCRWRRRSARRRSTRGRRSAEPRRPSRPTGRPANSPGRPVRS